MNRAIKRTLQLGSFTALVSLAPVEFSTDAGVTERQACAQSGTCCRESGSLCIIGDHFSRDYYYKSEGSCKVQET